MERPLTDPILLARLIDHSPDALLIVSSRGLITFANATCNDLLEYEPAELLGQSPEILVPPEVRRTHQSHRAAFNAAPSRRTMGRLNTLTAVTKSGRVVPVDISLSPIGHDADGPLIVVAIRDARAQRAFVGDLERQATTDPLTGALNRRSFENAFAREAERCRRAGVPLFVMMLDIDHFKKVNDRYGHAAGDEALKKLVAACHATLRKTDVLARIGGEEFAALAPASDAAEAMALAERLRENIMTVSVPAGSENFGYTVSIGLSHPAADGPLAEALRTADLALYEAKRNGRNRVVLAARNLAHS